MLLLKTMPSSCTTKTPPDCKISQGSPSEWKLMEQALRHTGEMQRPSKSQKQVSLFSNLPLGFQL